MRYCTNGWRLMYPEPRTGAGLVEGVTSSLATFHRRKRGCMGMWFRFLGLGAENTTGTYKIFGLNEIVAGGTPQLSPPNAPKLWDRTLCVSGNFTLGAAVGDGAYLAATLRYADTVDRTLSAFMTAIETAYGMGLVTAFSPADNTRAVLFATFLPFDGIEMEATAASGVQVEYTEVLMVE